MKKAETKFVQDLFCCLNDKYQKIIDMLPINPPPIPIGRGPGTFLPDPGIVPGVTRTVDRLVDGVNQPLTITDINRSAGNLIGPAAGGIAGFRGFLKSSNAGNIYQYDLNIVDPDPNQYLVFELYNYQTTILRDLRVEFSRNPIRVQSNATVSEVGGNWSYKFPTTQATPADPFMFLPGPLTIRVWNDSNPVMNSTQLVWNFWNLQTPPP